MGMGGGGKPFAWRAAHLGSRKGAGSGLNPD